MRLNIYIITSLLLSYAHIAKAEVKINFEDASAYRDIGVYDVWEDSPFRTGVLEGNVAVVGNPDLRLNQVSGKIANESEKVLGAQRSRFGSNRFGVRIDLNEPVSLSADTLYVHALINKPKDGRVMLVGLGSRKERLGQNPDTEQFYVLSASPVVTGEWFDAVFPIRGAEGVEVRSLVIVPDCESPHDLKEDFLFYIDDVEINQDAAPRLQVVLGNDGEDEIFGDKVIVNDNQLNGEVVAADGRKLNSLELEAGKPFKIRMVPEKGFHNGGMKVRFGRNPGAENQRDPNGNILYEERIIPAKQFDSENCYELPAELMRGRILIIGIMEEDI